MIELEQLQHLITFQECETLSKAAKQLHISQPVLTRSMQKLEEELEVSLFTRTKNKISFNETGLLAASLASRLLEDTKDMKKQLQDFERKLHTFAIGSCAPAPLLYMGQKVSQYYPQKALLTEIKDMSILMKGLKEKDYIIIIMPYNIEDYDIESIPFMEEQLFFSLPLSHRFANRKSISLKEMDGERMLLMSNIGFWHEMHQRTMPHTKFIIQNDRSIFYDLVELSSLPSFTSDYVMKTETMPQNRHIIPIEDKEAKATFYCWYLKENEIKLKSLLYHL
ncbi:LysR family transcriptional regulator [Allocoprobacillus halotolerans]|uniref:LysR family transcriptional regulator n=1 Tax=Allocoprobacillus halotolerans TaxID=2944914 RepID=A0ABY5I691_9FIRM|nr:LysR family transcriptional regulator [Allocoprobacillus halotolerans]UTY40595.1 LysR family transcriptional regulator [Allocoprobacillus halotolerans]